MEGDLKSEDIISLLYYTLLLHNYIIIYFIYIEVEVKLDRESVGYHLGPATNISFSLKFSLDICGFVIL
jgi:hypothetical protein